ncbi:amidohydrolase family protein [Paraburkholderia sp. LEh10]|uniref:amidohydrolase family protein n=1 Tax=Paraburkholderia sp. LEh10 TaxID=2821353 RepID=UPI001AE125A4|nr:amidohydrolase family protein [Paraburkholderia sp. LEh10]MBP0596009.1 amidohydrolase family protein [Paraburkholderia sp. LEh10]
MTFDCFVKLIAINTAKAYGLHPRKGSIGIGSDADPVIYDEHEFALRNSDLHHDVDYTPYKGQMFVAASTCATLEPVRD